MDTSPGLIDRLVDRPGRLLVPADCLRAREKSNRLTALARGGVCVRTVPAVPGDAMVVDGTLITRALPGEATTVVRLLDCLWAAGAPLALPGFTIRERKVLLMLSTGRTDESMAAELGLSVRTVRRMISAFMDRLGARSRYEAGVLAANRGWPVSPDRHA